MRRKENNLYLIDTLLKGNEGKSITIKNCWEGENLFSQKRDTAQLEKNFFITVKR